MRLPNPNARDIASRFANYFSDSQTTLRITGADRNCRTVRKTLAEWWVMTALVFPQKCVLTFVRQRRTTADMDKRFSLRMPAQMVRALAQAAKARHLSIADIVREAVFAHIAKIGAAK